MPFSRAELDRIIADPVAFSRTTRRLLRSYQGEAARAIARSVIRSQGKTFTVMFARQMGKNETSAQLEAYLLRLYAGEGGLIVKAAPSFKPQLVTSMLRLQETLSDSVLTRRLWRPRFGYIIGCGGASITFLSADPGASVVGATASLLLEVDEAQDVDPDLYDRAFRPMASSTNATTVLYGTAWNEDSILQRQIVHNAAIERRSGERLNFRCDWTVLAAENAAYRRFVEGEIARLGEEHPAIQTQYLLHCLSNAGRLFSGTQQDRLRSDHPRELQPLPAAVYVAGIDLAGEDEQAEDAVARALVPRRDSTVITIASVERDGTGNAAVRVVNHIWWTGRDPARQYDDFIALWEQWRFARVCVDASGIGAATASFLARRFGSRVKEVVFSPPTKSRLGFELLAMVNTGRLSVYAGDGSAEVLQLWREVKTCRYHLRKGQILAWGVPPTEGHDDFIASLALCCRAARNCPAPAASSLVRSPRPAEEIGRW
jgi:hypothetical protein